MGLAMNAFSGVVAWWMDRPWWLRWLITLVPLGIVAVQLLAFGGFHIWLLAIGGLMFVVNLFLSWGEILDAITGRKK